VSVRKRFHLFAATTASEHIVKRWSPLGCDADTLPEIENAADADC